jgi:hypothetical protein
MNNLTKTGIILSIGVFIALVTLLLTFIEPIVLHKATIDADKNVISEALTFSWALVWVFASIAYIVFSFRWYKDKDGKNGFIEANEIGVRTFFGKPTDELSSGLPFVPFGFFQLEKLSVVVQQQQFPGESRNIYRGEMKDFTELPENKVPPFKVTFRNSVTEAEAVKLLHEDEHSVTDENGEIFTFIATAPKDGLARRVTAELVPVVRWKIIDGIKFIRNIYSINEANRQLEDELFSVLVRLLPNMSVGQAIQNFRWINTILKKQATTRTEGWGIKIEGAFLKMIPLNHDLNSAISLASEAEFQGRGERELLEQRGAGTAKAAEDLERKTLEGRAAGLKKLAKDLGIEGDAAIAQFVAGQLAEGDGTIILGAEGLSQLAGIGAALLNKQSN